MNRVALFAVLPLRDAHFIRLAASLGALSIRLLVGRSFLWLSVAAYALLRAVAGRSVSVSHNSAKWNTKRMQATNVAILLAGRFFLLALNDREVITHLGLVINERGVQTQAIEVEH